MKNNKKDKKTKVFVLHIFTERQPEKSDYLPEIKKELKLLSERLAEQKIYHLIVNEKDRKNNWNQAIYIVDDMPSACFYNSEKEQWEYDIRYMKKFFQEPFLLQKCIIQDSNPNIDILSFILKLLECNKEVKN